LRVAGRLPPDTENPVPVIKSELMVTGAVPLEVTVTDLVTALPTATFPNDKDAALTLKEGTAAFSWIATPFDDLFALASTVAACEVLTEATFAVNEVAVAPAGTVMLAGTVTALLLLVKVTPRPPAGAAELSETVHVVVLAPVNELPLHENALIESVKGGADALKLIVAVLEADPCVAVSFTVCEVVTADTVAAKLALVAPEGTDTEAGTITVSLLLARLINMPLLGAGAVNATLQESMPAPIIDELAQFRLVNEAANPANPFPCNFTEPGTFNFVLLIALTLSSPVESVADPGSNRTWTVMLPPAASVAGSAPAFTVKVVVDVVKSAICTADVPEFVIETLRYTGVPTLTSPKSTIVGFSTSAGVLDEENGLASAPHPDSPRLSPMVAIARAMTEPAMHLLEFLSLTETSGRIALIFSSTAKE
jgi:hypothetical protein